jgi:hypothetical protein
MPFSSLATEERKVFSQNGEDGVIQAILDRIGTTNRFFVEFGCGDGMECNTAHLRRLGWSGLLMDGGAAAANHVSEIRREFITAENINDLFRKYDVPRQFDLLSIDIDGNDFWVWNRIEHRPRIVVIEYNASQAPHLRRAIRYAPNFQWTGTDYFGASLLALKTLGELKGYRLVYCERTGVNAFFVCDEALPPGYVPPPLESIYRPPNYFGTGRGFPPEQARSWVDPFSPVENLYFRIDV